MRIEKKIWPEYFEKILSGDKTWDPATKEYTGRKIEKVVTYVGKTKEWTFWPAEDIDKYGYQIIGFK